MEGISKTHNKMTNETRISTWYRSKLKNQYTAALEDANNECQVIREGLNIIGKIKAIQVSIVCWLCWKKLYKKLQEIVMTK